WASAVQAIVTGKRCDRGEVVNGKLPARRPHEGDATSLNARGVHLRACPGWFSFLRGHFLHFGLAKHTHHSSLRIDNAMHSSGEASLWPVGANLDQNFLVYCSEYSVVKRAARPGFFLASEFPAGMSSPSGSIHSPSPSTPPRRVVIPFLRAVLIRRRGILLEVLLNPLPLFGRHCPAPAVAALPALRTVWASCASRSGSLPSIDSA